MKGVIIDPLPPQDELLYPVSISIVTTSEQRADLADLVHEYSLRWTGLSLRPITEKNVDIISRLTTGENISDILGFVAYFGNTPVGCVIVLSHTGMEKIEIVDFFVMPGFQHRGIGRKLFAMADEVARASDHIVNLAVLDDNVAAIAIYEQFGYEQMAIFTDNGRTYRKYLAVTAA